MKPNKQLTLDGVTTVERVEKSILASCKGKAQKHGTQQLKDEAHARAERVVQMLLTDTYRIGEYREFDICERGKQRHIQHVRRFDSKDLNVTDGGVLRFIVDMIEPDVLNCLTDNTHAAVKYHGAHLALKQLRSYLQKDPVGTEYCYKIDIRHYFPNIDRTILKRTIRRIWNDPKLLRMLDQIIDTAPGNLGIPIGNHTSQIYANIFLAEFDHWVQNTFTDVYYIRYMDDIVILSGSKERLRHIHREVEWYLMRNLNLTIKPNWQIFPVAARGVDFVGYRTWSNKVLMRKANLKRMIADLKTIKINILTTGELSDHDRSVLGSRLGGVYHCTPKVRCNIFEKYFRPIFYLLPPEAHIKLPGGTDKWNMTQNVHTHKSKQTRQYQTSTRSAHSCTSTLMSETNPMMKSTHVPKDTKTCHTSAHPY